MLGPDFSLVVGRTATFRPVHGPCRCHVEPASKPDAPQTSGLPHGVSARKNYSNDSIYRDTLTPKRRAQAPVGSQLTTSPYTSFWLTDAESCLAEYRLQGTTHLEGK